MACYHPWWKDRQVLPCGQCRGCRAAYHREWSARCVHEACMHEVNSFVTLTYDDEHLPVGGSLDLEAVPVLIRALRKRGKKVRYFYCGEYGERSGRPHYHALLFGLDFPDKKLYSVRNGYPVFRSRELECVWKSGLCEIGSVTPSSAGYVTRYISKRITGSWAKAKYGDRVPEFGRMSRNPGIGAAWIDKYGFEVFAQDRCHVNGSFVKPPRYYVNRAGVNERANLEMARFLVLKPEDNTPERLEVRDVV